MCAHSVGSKKRRSRHVVHQGREQPPSPRKKRKSKRSPPRLKAYWGIFNDRFQRVALFEYSDRKKAEKAVRELTDSKKISHFIQVVKAEIT
jgi:hypothetical protein